MGGFAVLSMLPTHIRHNIQYRFAGHKYPRAFDQASPLSKSMSRNFTPSLKIFYILILANAVVLVIGSSIIGLMRQRYVRSSVKSLCKYHDRMMQSSFNWLHPAIDFSFAFNEIQGCQYRKGKDARYVCENYADLIYFLYMHDKGVEVAEAALASDDVFTKEAAANIVGFWAVMDTLENVQGRQVPLCFAKGLLSKLADIAAESYDSLGTAAAWSFLLLLDVVDEELIGMVASVQSKSTNNQDLIEILLVRAAEVLYPPCPQHKLPEILLKKSHAHLYALKRYIFRLQNRGSHATVFQKNGQLEEKIELQDVAESLMEKLNKKISDKLPQLSTETSLKYGSLMDKLDKKISDLKLEPLDHEKYRADIKRWLEAETLGRSSTWAILIKTCCFLLLNTLVPLTCLGIGFIVNALLFKPSS